VDYQEMANKLIEGSHIEVEWVDMDILQARAWRNEILAAPIVDEESFEIFLHELGHCVLGHTSCGALKQLLRNPPDIVRQEYEADIFAIDMMKSLQVPIPEMMLKIGKEDLRMLIDQYKEQGYKNIDSKIKEFANGY